MKNWIRFGPDEKGNGRSRWEQVASKYGPRAADKAQRFDETTICATTMLQNARRLDETAICTKHDFTERAASRRDDDF